MINKNEINNNITALCEVFLENKQDELETVDELIISLIKKDNSTEDFTIPKNELVSKMITICENGLSNVRDIEINYYNNGELKKINGITIF